MRPRDVLQRRFSAGARFSNFERGPRGSSVKRVGNGTAVQFSVDLAYQGEIELLVRFKDKEGLES